MRLIPFEAKTADGLQADCTLERHNSLLTARYQVTGKDAAGVSAPAPSPKPMRLDGLWKTTCFELFLGEPGREPYWEFNFSPSGDWNVYSFAGYRTGQKPDTLITLASLEFKRTAGGMMMTAVVDLSHSPLKDKNLTASVTCVVESAGGRLSYWALAHAGGKPDFHLRNSFIHPLPAPGLL